MASHCGEVKTRAWGMKGKRQADSVRRLTSDTKKPGVVPGFMLKMGVASFVRIHVDAVVIDSNREVGLILFSVSAEKVDPRTNNGDRDCAHDKVFERISIW